jgi:hypothetical protein
MTGKSGLLHRKEEEVFHFLLQIALAGRPEKQLRKLQGAGRLESALKGTETAVYRSGYKLLSSTY